MSIFVNSIIFLILDLVAMTYAVQIIFRMIVLIVVKTAAKIISQYML